jgi:phospholipase D1/2
MHLIKEGEPGYGNIRVMRHPDHNVFENAGDMTFYWAHHEKFIVIDYAMAFIGGLDLCYGRWDEKQHPLADVHPSGVHNNIFPGQDFNNNRILDFDSVDDWKSNKLDKLQYGRMPWHDVAMGLIGPAVYDIAEHFVLRWNFMKRDKYKRDERYEWLTMEGREGKDEDIIGVQRPKYPVGGYIHHPKSPLSTKNLDNRGTVHAQLVRSSADWSMGIDPHEQSIQNAYCELIRNAEHFVYIENQFFITATSKHDENPVHNQIGAAIVDAVVRAGKEGRNFRVIIVIPAIPGFAGDLRDNAAAGTRAIMDYQFKSICRGDESIFGKVRAQDVDPEKHIFFFNLRSYDRINVTPTLKKREEESGLTYLELEQAEIEELEAPLEEEGEAARKKAAELRRRFAGNHEDVGLGDQGGVLDPDSIADDAMLTEKKPSTEEWEGDPEEEKEHFFQEELYIHAKLCIVDDKYVICGSSNINDRSQLGFHDSELSIVLQDKDEIDSEMDGKPYKAARLAHELRSNLWREHLGLLPPQALDAKDDPNAQPPNTAATTPSPVPKPTSSATPCPQNSGTNGKSAQPQTQKFSARSSTPILITTSKHSKTTIVLRRTPRQTRTTSKVTCTIRFGLCRRFERSWIALRDIWSGCSWSFWRMRSWRNEGCRSTRLRRVSIPKCFGCMAASVRVGILILRRIVIALFWMMRNGPSISILYPTNLMIC